MEALIELCDLIAQNPTQLSDKLAWICSRCPPPESLINSVDGSARISRSQINALLAIARFLSNNSNHADPRPVSVVLEFIRSIPMSFNPSFWPQSLGVDSVYAFFVEFLGYVSIAVENSEDFASDVSRFFGEIVISAILKGDDSTLSKAFLTAVAQNCLPVTPLDAEKLICYLLEQYVSNATSSPRQIMISSSATSSSQGSPIALTSNHSDVSASANSSPMKRQEDDTESVDDGTSISSKGVKSNGVGFSGRSSLDQFSEIGIASMQRHGSLSAADFEEESLECLERQETAFKLIGHVLMKTTIKHIHLEQIRLAAANQLKSIPDFLKIRKRDWTEQGTKLKARINTKLSLCKAATVVQIRSLTSLNSDVKATKTLLRWTLAFLLEAAEACLLSSWRKLKVTEELFSSLLNGIKQIAVIRGGHLLRVLLIRLKPLVITTCAQAETEGSNPGFLFESVTKMSCEIIEFGWSSDKAPVDTFIMGLAASIRERNDQDEQDEKARCANITIQLNVIRLLADLCMFVKKCEVVEMILPLFIESLEEGDGSNPGPFRQHLLDAISRMASLGFEKSYRETVVLMTRSYMDKLSSIACRESKTLTPEITIEHTETLPSGFLSIARGLTSPKLRSDYRHRLLSLCSDVGLASEGKVGRSGADFLGPLLPAVAEICSDFNPTSQVNPTILKLFRNLWFYVVLFGLAPPIQKYQLPSKSIFSSLNTVGSMSTIALQAVSGPYMWKAQWSLAVQRIAQGTPPLVLSSVKWLEDELELNALHNPGSGRGSGNEKAAFAQRAALSAALGGRVEVAAMSTISGVKATYLLAVVFLEIIRFSFNGGILCGNLSSEDSTKSAFSCVFEYLNTPNLMPAVSQCLTAMVHCAFETAVRWLEERVLETGREAEIKEGVLTTHSCYLINNMSQRESHVRDLSVSLLAQLKDKFPQILWNASCLDSLLFSFNADVPSTVVNDPAWVTTVRSLFQRTVRDWITNALSYAPCTAQGLLQEKLCKLNAWQRVQSTTDVISLLSEIQLGTGKSDCWVGTRTANIPAVIAAAAAASGASLKMSDSCNLEVLSTGIVSATIKSNHAGEIAGMKRLYNSIGGFQNGNSLLGLGLSPGLQAVPGGSSLSQTPKDSESFNEIILSRFVRLLQQFVNTAEKGIVDKSSFREVCSQATALLLSNLESGAKSNLEGFSQLLRLLCWCPAFILTPDAMEIGVFVWTWMVSAAPQFGSLVLSELVDAWLWTIDTKRGLFASELKYSGPAAKLRPHLTPGEPEEPPKTDPVQGIIAHRLWLGFFIDRFEVIRHDSVEQLLLLGRMLQGSMKSPSHFSHHPAATGTFFTLMLLGLKFCSCQVQISSPNRKIAIPLLVDRIYRASLGWFAYDTEWYETNNKSFSQSEAQSVSMFVHHLINEKLDAAQTDSSLKARCHEVESSSCTTVGSVHPVWGSIENCSSGREKRKQLLLMLCQCEADRLDIWAQPTNSKENAPSRPKVSSDKWIEYVRTAFSVDPRISISLTTRFPTIGAIKAEVTQLVQVHVLEVRHIPEALPFFVTPKAVDENSILLQQLPHWASCSITQALEFLTPAFKGHPRVMAYVLRVLETYPPEKVTFFMPQLIQALRYDEEKLVEKYLLGAAQRSNIFSHILIWHLQGETGVPESGKESGAGKNNSFQSLLPLVRQQIIDSFTPEARDMFEREFNFFDQVTSISGVLFSLPKEERRAGIRRELEKIELDGDDLYLPTAPSKLVRSIQLDSGIPLQSAAKVPIMVTFNVVDKYGDENDIKPQACIFKVGDDCRQDVLALQVISLLRDIFEAIGLNLYLFPYGVLPTGPERGIIEVVPNTRSRNQMAETTDGGLYEIFQQDYGPVGSPTFEAARDNFIVSSAGYAVASLLLQPKDRHNGNLLFDSMGRLVHIDFGFILETSPGGNIRFESAQFKLSHEMTQLLDPSGSMKSETWTQFVSLCVKGYLAARRHMDGIISTVSLMVDSGLPCFSRGDPLGNLRKRFHPEMSEREAANFMIRTCSDAYNKWSTAGYDLIQYIQQGIEK